jgi:hypothetical protein
MNTLELAFGYRDAAKNIIWEKPKVSAQHPRKYYGCLSGEGWGRRELLPSLYYAKAYTGKAHGTIAFMDATGLRRWNAHLVARLGCRIVKWKSAPNAERRGGHH